MLEAAVEKCSACRQTLWGLVRYCPFCGAKMASDEACTSADAGAGEEPELAPPQDVAEAETPAVVKAPVAKRKLAAPAPNPPTPEKPRQRAPQPPENTSGNGPQEGASKPAAPAAPTAPTASPRGNPLHKLLAGAALAGVLVYWFWDSPPSGPDACDQSLALAQSATQQENAQEARQYSQEAMGACKDTARARLAKTADESAQALLKTQLQAKARAEQQSRQLEQQQAQQQAQQRMACEGVNRLTASLLQTARLDSARQNLQRVDDACRQMGETQALSAQLGGLQATANKATADASAHLADGALGPARTSIEVLASVNRESADLPELRAALNKAQAAMADAAVRSAPAPAPAVQTELLRSFLRDAEASMQQRLYDKAKTYAESAQRIDPRNPEVARLLRRIKEHEMSYLRDRIVIE